MKGAQCNPKFGATDISCIPCKLHGPLLGFESWSTCCAMSYFCILCFAASLLLMTNSQAKQLRFSEADSCTHALSHMICTFCIQQQNQCCMPDGFDAALLCIAYYVAFAVTLYAWHPCAIVSFSGNFYTCVPWSLLTFIALQQCRLQVSLELANVHAQTRAKCVIANGRALQYFLTRSADHHIAATLACLESLGLWSPLNKLS